MSSVAAQKRPISGVAHPRAAPRDDNAVSHGTLQRLLDGAPAQPLTLRRNFIVSATQELDEAKPVPEWISHGRNAPPGVRPYLTFKARTRPRGPNRCRYDIRYNKV